MRRSPGLPQTSRPQPSPVSAEDAIKRREALEELVQSDGWQIFSAHLLREWQGIGYQQRMGGALESTDPLAGKVIHRTAIEVARFLQWPVEQLRELKGHTE